MLITYVYAPETNRYTPLRCPGRPAIEITRYVDTHEGTGAVGVGGELCGGSGTPRQVLDVLTTASSGCLLL